MSSMLLLPSWKEEPLSPPSNCGDESSSSSPNIHFDNTTFYDDNFEYKLEDDDLSGCESKAEVASHILENLENLVDLDELIKDEPYLLDVKMLPPLLEDVEPPRAVLVPIQQIKSETINIINNNHNKSSSPPPDPETTQYLLNEFETMYDVVELAHHGTLTPPQSPPSVLTTLEPLLAPPSSSYHHHHHPAESTTATTTPILPYTTSVALPQDIENGGMVVEMYHHNTHPTVLHQHHHHQQPPTDIAHELAVVDELVRSRVEDMQWSSGNSCSGSSSPGSPGGASSSSNFGDCSSDDPEWVPDAAALENLSSSQTTTFPTIKSTKSSRKQQRSKPYTKAPPEEKKVRKKEQNKNAATRYRLKKKAEVEEILTEEKILLDKSTDLGNQITDLQREIKYLKGLMRDLFKAKGLLN